MSASLAILAAAEGGIIGDGRTGANLAVGAALIGVGLGGWALARVTGRIDTGNARIGALSAMGAGLVGTVLAVLHLVTSSGGPGTGNGLVGAIAAVPLGLLALILGRRALTRSLHTVRPAGSSRYERRAGSA